MRRWPPAHAPLGLFLLLVVGSGESVDVAFGPRFEPVGDHAIEVGESTIPGASVPRARAKVTDFPVDRTLSRSVKPSR